MNLIKKLWWIPTVVVLFLVFSNVNLEKIASDVTGLIGNTVSATAKRQAQNQDTISGSLGASKATTQTNTASTPKLTGKWWASSAAATPGVGNRKEPWLKSGLKYYFPLQGYSKPIGIPTSHGRDCPGAADLAVPIGTTFVAVTDGKIVEIQWEDKSTKADANGGPFAGGLWVTIVGDDGFRYHGSHLSFVEPNLRIGQHVYAGQRLGKTGITGNAKTLINKPSYHHLHFGISKPANPASANNYLARCGTIQPARVLRTWQAGQSATP